MSPRETVRKTLADIQADPNLRSPRNPRQLMEHKANETQG
jgi:hypothetical protein